MTILSTLSGSNKLYVIAGLAVTVTTAVALIVWNKKRKNGKDYKLVGFVAGLYCYPIKSCSEITNNIAFCTYSGLRMSNAMDRNFLVIRPDGSFVTQRQIPKLAGIKLSTVGQELQLEYDGKEPIRVPLYPKLNEDLLVDCRIWKNHVVAQSCGQAVADWLNSVLEQVDLQLVVYIHGVTIRKSSTKNATDKDMVSFPDESPYHLATIESFQKLMSVLEDDDGTVTMQNFRPNIVIKSYCPPWEEDKWAKLKIGDKLTMRILAPCDRCIMTTVDQQRCDRRCNEEPLKTLRRIRIDPRISKTAPLFGIFAGVDVEETIRVGDPIYAIYN